MLNHELQYGNLKQISLIEHGNIESKDQPDNKFVERNRWKSRINSDELKEDFKDIFELREQTKQIAVFNDNGSTQKSKNNVGLLSTIMNELDQISKTDTKKLLNGIDKPFVQLATKQDSVKIKASDGDDEKDLIDLFSNTKNVTEKIKLLNIFDDFEDPRWVQGQYHNEEVIVTDEPDKDIEMLDLDTDDDNALFLISDDGENMEYGAHVSNTESDDILMLDMDENRNNVSVANILKSIINPTELGIQLAQNKFDNANKQQNTEVKDRIDNDDAALNRESNTENHSTEETEEKAMNISQAAMNIKNTAEGNKEETDYNNHKAEDHKLFNLVGEEEECFKPRKEAKPTTKNSYQSFDSEGKTVTINNHYYNYFHMAAPAPPSYYKNTYEASFCDNEFDNVSKEMKKLPNPWSSHSLPLKKQIYDVSSYCQIVLNIILYFLIILLTAIFIKSVTQDLTNLFYQQKQHHINDVLQCTRLYDINKCYLQIPKMHDQCGQWQRCMIEDVDKKFINKTKIFIRLFADLLKEFLNAVGFLNCVSLFMLIYSGYFGANLIFGYIRGKSYGSINQQKNNTKPANERIEDVDEFDEKYPKNDDNGALILTH